MRKLPGISIVVATYDGSLATLNRCLSLVRSQNYPQKLIEIVLGHGGTLEGISKLAKKYGCKVKIIPPHLQNAEYNRGIAFNSATKELALILDHDNFMPDSNYLKNLVRPLVDDTSIVASESCYFHYDKSYSTLDRYYSLIGTLDPIPYYLGKADRMSQTSKNWNLLGKSIDKGEYFLVEFEKDPRKIPTVGTNGCLMRREVVVKNANVSPGFHYPIDVMVDTIRSGHNKFAFVKNSLIHLTGARGIGQFLSRRLKFVEQYHFADNSKRRYSVFMPGDELKLLAFILISVTLIVPIIDSIKGYLKIRDPAWFVHPIMCVGICLVYGLGVVRSKLKRI